MNIEVVNIFRNQKLVVFNQNVKVHSIKLYQKQQLNQNCKF